MAFAKGEGDGMTLRSLGTGGPDLKTSFDFDRDDGDVKFTGKHPETFLEWEELPVKAAFPFGKNQKAFPVPEKGG